MNEKGEFYLPNRTEFQSVITYKDASKSPPLVVRHTHNLLGLFYQGVNVNPQPAQDYLRSHSLDYFNSAIEGSSSLYDRFGALKEVELEAREAAHHALVVFSFMRERAKSQFFPVGFSSKGILRAPATHREYIRRMRELQAGIAQVATGMVHPRTILETNPALFRVFKFFEVGSELEIKLTESEEKQKKMQTEQLNELLGDSQIDLG